MKRRKFYVEKEVTKWPRIDNGVDFFNLNPLLVTFVTRLKTISSHFPECYMIVSKLYLLLLKKHYKIEMDFQDYFFSFNFYCLNSC